MIASVGEKQVAFAVDRDPLALPTCAETRLARGTTVSVVAVRGAAAELERMPVWLDAKRRHEQVAGVQSQLGATVREEGCDDAARVDFPDPLPVLTDVESPIGSDSDAVGRV
jgi:hypothetical protein